MQAHQNTSQNKGRPWLRIRQQKYKQTLVAQTDMLHQLDPEHFDIATIQEPFLDLNYNTWYNHYWYIIYPRVLYIEQKKTKTVMFINKNIWLTPGFRSTLAHQISQQCKYKCS